MLTEIYIEALLVDEELADQVWDARNHSGPGMALCLSGSLASGTAPVLS